MDALSIAWMAAAAVSFFCERLAVTAFGFPVAMVLAATAVLLPELLNRLVVPVFFQPDVIIAVDPSERDAQSIARGVRQAMRVCLAEGRVLRLLIARVPGSVVTIGLNAVRQRVFATIGSEAKEAVVMKSQSALPPFFPSEAATWYRLTRGGDNVRLCFHPSEQVEETVVCQTPVVGWWTVAFSGLFLLGGVWAWGGAWVAGVAVFPFLVIRLLTHRHAGPAPGFRVKPIFLIMGSLCVIGFNLARLAMF